MDCCLRALFFLLLAVIPPLHGNLKDIKIKAESAILINAETGTVLYEKNARQKQFPASLTKVATAIYALEVRGNRLDKMIAAEHDCVASISDDEMKRSNGDLSYKTRLELARKVFGHTSRYDGLIADYLTEVMEKK